MVEGRADTVAAAVSELECYLQGRDPDQIEDIWQVMYRGGFYRGGPVLMSAIAAPLAQVTDAIGVYKGTAAIVPRGTDVPGLPAGRVLAVGF